MLDIRIEIPEDFMQTLNKTGRLALPLRSISRNVAFSAWEIMGPEGKNRDSTLTRDDFWTRASAVETSKPIVFVDVTMAAKADLTPELKRDLAKHIRKNLDSFLIHHKIKGAGVLVWIHMKDLESEVSKTEPTAEFE